MIRRRVLVDIDSIVNLFKDYLTEDYLPADAMPLKFFINPTEQGKLGILVFSDRLPVGPPIPVTFQIKRLYGV
jgi:hypothetical protein